VKGGPVAPAPRACLTREEAAAAIGVSLSHFERHVQPDLRLVRSGGARLVPVAELVAWADRTATLAGGDGRIGYQGGAERREGRAGLGLGASVDPPGGQEGEREAVRDGGV
jgi:hypothetical protein